MREIVFITQNEERWRSIERHVADPWLVEPDVLASEYVSLMDDMAYSRAHYPKSHTTAYLNELASLMHLVLTTNQKSHVRSIREFWFRTVPMSFIGIRKELKIVALGLTFMMAIAYFAGLPSTDLARAVLGDAYVDMTIENILSGYPMGVYSRSSGIEMFAAIFANNFFVMLRVVSLGLIPVLGVMGSVIHHGVMLGSFHALFAQYDVLGTSLSTVWIHGAFEMSSFVVSAAAGLHASLAYLNPGTLPRGTAFVQATRRSVIVAVGMIPFVLIAAVLESFVTRLSDMPLALDIAIIVVSFACIWGYVIVLPSFLTSSRKINVRTVSSSS